MEVKKRKIGLDIGTKRIGISQSDILCMIASPIETYERKGLNRDTQYVADLAKKLEADTIVMGLPLKMSGEEAQSVDMVKLFAEKLSEKTDCKLEFVDERFTTVMAQKVLIESDMRREKRKNVVDSVASQIILQTYLDKNYKNF